jgi:DNA-binding GntR family transcriptional regulator
VLSICSSLITVVDNRGSRVVQFSHFSVKEFFFFFFFLNQFIFRNTSQRLSPVAAMNRYI